MMKLDVTKLLLMYLYIRANKVQLVTESHDKVTQFLSKRKQ